MVVCEAAGSLVAFLKGSLGSSLGVRVSVSSVQDGDEFIGSGDIDLGPSDKVAYLVIGLVLEETNNIMAAGLFIEENVRFLELKLEFGFSTIEFLGVAGEFLRVGHLGKLVSWSRHGTGAICGYSVTAQGRAWR